MSKACPIPTPAERRYGEITERAVKAMMQRIHAALDDARDEVVSESEAAGLDLPPPSRDHLAAIADQRLFCLLCGADPDTFEGGRRETALAIIRNKQNIARHYWGAAVEPEGR